MTTKRWILVAAVLGSGIVFLDSTVVNVALPRIGRDLPRSFLGVLEGQSYVYNAYLLTLSSLLILAGALSDFYGRRRMFLYGLVGFGATSVLCGLAPSMELLVLFRILQGAAGAMLVPGSLALLIGVDGSPPRDAHYSSSRKLYPAPRTVCSRGLSKSLSIAWRRRLMCTSMTLVCGSK